jgi:hypothetical protein
MSLPVSMVPAIALSPIDAFLNIFNTNPYFIGLTMLILNLGGRFLSLEVTKKQEQFLQHPWVRRLLIFVVIFVGTRSIYVAFWGTLLVVLFLGYLFNENSALCVFGQKGAKGSTCSNPDISNEIGMTVEEKEILQRLMAKSQRIQTKVEPDAEDDVLHTDIYAANMVLLRR